MKVEALMMVLKSLLLVLSKFVFIVFGFIEYSISYYQSY